MIIRTERDKKCYDNCIVIDEGVRQANANRRKQRKVSKKQKKKAQQAHAQADQQADDGQQADDDGQQAQDDDSDDESEPPVTDVTVTSQAVKNDNDGDWWIVSLRSCHVVVVHAGPVKPPRQAYETRIVSVNVPADADFNDDVKVDKRWQHPWRLASKGKKQNTFK